MKYLIRKQWITYFLMAMIPMAIVLIGSYFAKTNLLLARPVWSDEIGYWRELFSFNAGSSTAQGGFYGFNSASGNFGAHGYSPFIVWGIPALFGQWNYFSIPITNLIILTAAVFLAMIMAEPKKEKLIFIILLLLTYTPFIKYFYSSMMEIPCIAAAILAAGALVQYERSGTKPAFLVFTLTVIFSALVRINMSLFFIPGLFILFRKNHFSRLKSAVFLLIWLAFTIGLYYFNQMVTKPYPYSDLYGLTGSIWDKLSAIFIRTVDNLVLFIIPSLATAQEAAQRYFILVLIIVLTVSVISQLRKKEDPDAGTVGITVCCFLSLCAVLSMYLVYDYRDYRMLAPIVIFALLWVILTDPFSMEKKLKYALLASYICGIAVFLPGEILSGIPEERYIQSDYPQELHSLLENETGTVIVYDVDLTVEEMSAIPANLSVQSAVGLKDELRVFDGVDYIIAKSSHNQGPYKRICEFADGKTLYKKKTQK